MELIGGTEKYMAVCRNCYHLEAPVKRSPFKTLTPPSTNQNGATGQAPPRVEVAEKKRKLFDSEPEVPTKSLRQTEV